MQRALVLLPLVWYLSQLPSQTKWMSAMRYVDYWKVKLNQDMALPKAFKLSRSRIMYIEAKSEGLEGEAVIGRVYF